MVLAPARVDLPALKAAHPLGDVVEASGVALRAGGRVRQGVCPFHDEAEGSFTVYADSQRYYCFGCGAGGDVLDYLQRREGLSLPTAVERLAGAPAAAGTPAGPPATPFRPSAGTGQPRRDPAALRAAARHYAGALRRSGAAQDYLRSRGIDPDAAGRLGLGYAPGSGRGHCLPEALAAAGFSRGRLRGAGLLLAGGRERFAGMVVVPEIAHGRVTWLAGRAVAPGAAPRFQALPGPKPVLGLGRLGPTPPWAVVAEGLFDWLALAALGLPAVCALGTQGLGRVAAALRGCPRVVLAFDGDAAGRSAAAHLRALLGPRAAALPLPPGAGDVAELAARPGGRTAVLRGLAAALHTAGELRTTP